LIGGDVKRDMRRRLWCQCKCELGAEGVRENERGKRTIISSIHYWSESFLLITQR